MKTYSLHRWNCQLIIPVFYICQVCYSMQMSSSKFKFRSIDFPVIGVLMNMFRTSLTSNVHVFRYYFSFLSFETRCPISIVEIYSQIRRSEERIIYIIYNICLVCVVPIVIEVLLTVSSWASVYWLGCILLQCAVCSAFEIPKSCSAKQVPIQIDFLHIYKFIRTQRYAALHQIVSSSHSELWYINYAYYFVALVQLEKKHCRPK